MYSPVDIANYYCYRYAKDGSDNVDELKVHRLLYLAQRESLIRTDTPLFEESFYGWKYGPVLQSVRNKFKQDAFSSPKKPHFDEDTLVNGIYEKYAHKSSLYLGNLTYGEYCWKKSRNGIKNGDPGSRQIPLDDIRVDARRVKSLREYLSVLNG